MGAFWNLYVHFVEINLSSRAAWKDNLLALKLQRRSEPSESSATNVRMSTPRSSRTTSGKSIVKLSVYLPITDLHTYVVPKRRPCSARSGSKPLTRSFARVSGGVRDRSYMWTLAGESNNPYCHCILNIAFSPHVNCVCFLVLVLFLGDPLDLLPHLYRLSLCRFSKLAYKRNHT